MPERDDDFLQLVRQNEGRPRTICRVYADSLEAQLLDPLERRATVHR
ncbi:hypothetical protein [Salisaeta longa]|nr:hypothetical protein [Salisaeta longa]